MPHDCHYLLVAAVSVFVLAGGSLAACIEVALTGFTACG
jgi:hypothetical protein